MPPVRRAPERTAVARGGSFGALLRQWRERRRLSQLALAVEAEVSTPHLSFIETGRAQASRDMVLLPAPVAGGPATSQERAAHGRGLCRHVPGDGPRVSGNGAGAAGARVHPPP